MEVSCTSTKQGEGSKLYVYVVKTVEEGTVCILSNWG